MSKPTQTLEDRAKSSWFHSATQWPMVQHRIDKPLCKCEDCRAYLARLATLRTAGEIQ